ncbi:hypothetical protein ACFLXD_03955 [Chloroflexota bacterium]
MATKRRNLYLYLTLACFFGLIAIFIIDGYLGIYDTVYVTAGEREQEIEADFWLREDRIWPVESNWGEKIFFRYKVDNRQFFTYSTEVSASVWHSQEKVRDLISQSIQVAPFSQEQLEWEVMRREKPADIVPGQRYEISVIIKRGEVERRVILYITPVAYPLKPVPAPPR